MQYSKLLPVQYCPYMSTLDGNIQQTTAQDFAVCATTKRHTITHTLYCIYWFHFGDIVTASNSPAMLYILTLVPVLPLQHSLTLVLLLPQRAQNTLLGNLGFLHVVVFAQIVHDPDLKNSDIVTLNKCFCPIMFLCLTILL